MTRTMISVMALVLSVAASGCVGSVDPGVAEAELGGRRCASSDDCIDRQYCSTEDGDCNSACRPGEICTALCLGVCRNDHREQCGDRVCPSGTECCNASCGTCVEPGGFCTQQVCDSTTPL